MIIPKERHWSFLTFLFLAVQLLLYGLILTTSGAVLIVSEYTAIVLCFLYALLHIRSGKPLILAGLFFTVCADFFLVVCNPIQQLFGMLCFLCAQTCYCLQLHSAKPSKAILYGRLLFLLLLEIACFLILREKTDMLAIISLAYYGSLLCNIIAALAQRHTAALFPVALVLFILCDTVVGLQCAAGIYLPIPEDSLLHSVLFVNFNLAWLFYLPSQVLIALYAREK